ncbi:MAG: Holliday junction branch migration protein RuvA [Nitrospiria bacterium]
MIAWLNGTLIHKTPQMIILDVNNVGYQLQTSLPTFYALPELKASVSLYVYTHVREDAILLFGFLTQSERELFMLLLGVSGIGPKLAMTILSGLSPRELIKAVQEGDLAKLSAVSGIGKKTAGRMLLELKEKTALLTLEAQSSKIEGFQTPVSGSKLEEVLSALVNLGYNRQTIKYRVEAFCQENLQLSLEELIKESLKLFGKG